MDGKGLALGLLFGAVGSLVGCQAESPVASTGNTEIEVISAMEEAYLDELKAEMVYERVMRDFGEVRPFSNIINAEIRHSQAIAGLYQVRGLPLPANSWKAEDVPGFPSLSAACQGGVHAEIDNAAIYERYFSLDLPEDVRRVFENNRAASLNNHLPAFERCS